VRRINWIITTWFRSQHYFNTGGWRATWEGEGGGVLLNQAPHQLDLWQWFFGMPKRLRAFCYNGKYHQIETEDEATLFMEYENGATGVFITSTAENPGTNRLEITADRGKVVVENGKITYQRLKDSVQHAIETTKIVAWGGPSWDVSVGVPDSAGSPIREWVDAIKTGDSSGMITPGASGLNECLLASAAIQSGWNDAWVELAEFDDKKYEEQLRERIVQSDFVKPELSTPNYDEGY
jgi:predicted dehydrogenase